MEHSLQNRPRNTHPAGKAAGADPAPDASMRFPDIPFFAEVETLLAEGRPVQLRVQGQSMRPLLRNGRDEVLLIRYNPEKRESTRPDESAAAPCRPLRIGDIALFRFGKRHILHRIVRIEGDRITLAGDANPGTQEHCRIEDMIAIATHVIRPSGHSSDCCSRGWILLSRGWLLVPHALRGLLLRITALAGW